MAKVLSNITQRWKFTVVLRMTWSETEVRSFGGNFERQDTGMGFCEILALNYAPGAAAPGTTAPGAAAPGAWIIWSHIPSQICSRSIFECTMLQEYIANMLQEHIQNVQCSRSMFKYAPGAVYIQIMLLEHIELRILPQIIHAPGAAAPGAAVPGAAAPGA